MLSRLLQRRNKPLMTPGSIPSIFIEPPEPGTKPGKPDQMSYPPRPASLNCCTLNICTLSTTEWLSADLVALCVLLLGLQIGTHQTNVVLLVSMPRRASNVLRPSKKTASLSALDAPKDLQAFAYKGSHVLLDSCVLRLLGSSRLM